MIVTGEEQQRSDWDADCLSDEQLAYAARDAAILPPLYTHQCAAIAAAGLVQAAAIEATCTPTLAWLAHTGMPFNRPAREALAGAAVERRLLGARAAKERQLVAPLNPRRPARAQTLWRLP